LLLVRCSALQFHRIALPIAFTVMCSTVIALFFIPPGTTFSFISVSIATITGYYLSNYDYYLCTSIVDEKYFGVTNGVYWIGLGLILMCGGGVLLTPEITLAPAWRPVWLLISLGVIGLVSLHSVYLLFFLKDQLEKISSNHVSPTRDESGSTADVPS